MSAATRSEEFWEELRTMMERYRDIFGPLECTEHGDLHCCNHDNDSSAWDCWQAEGRIVPSEGSESFMLADIVVIAGYRDILKNRSWSMIAAPASQADYTTRGLLASSGEQV